MLEALRVARASKFSKMGANPSCFCPQSGGRLRMVVGVTEAKVGVHLQQ